MWELGFMENISNQLILGLRNSNKLCCHSVLQCTSKCTCTSFLLIFFYLVVFG